MAVYPAGNPGAYPVDTATDVGKFRVRIQDTQGTLYVPDEPGYANYVKASDAEIQSFVDDNSSLYWALSEFYVVLSASAAEQSKSVKDSDLAVDLKDRAEDLRKTAEMWAEKAVRADDLAGMNDVFEILPALGSAVLPRPPEGF